MLVCMRPQDIMIDGQQRSVTKKILVLSEEAFASAAQEGSAKLLVGYEDDDKKVPYIHELTRLSFPEEVKPQLPKRKGDEEVSMSMQIEHGELGMWNGVPVVLLRNAAKHLLT